MIEFGSPTGGSSLPQSVKRTATVTSVAHPSDRAVVLRLAVPDRVDHLPGQHYVIRLTAPDGYVAQRSYSVASAPSDDEVEFWIDRLPDGEVSGFLADVVEVGDQLDVRGPIGGWFVWDGVTPLLGVAGGSGAVPFAAMLRHARHTGTTDLVRLALSARTRAGLPYADEFEAAGALVRLTADGHRFAATDLLPLRGSGQTHLVCGSTAFSSAAVGWLQELGVATNTIRVESFGPSG
ncbi:ferredoxin reductase domain-containing protein [Jatrophihabitans fulvus]